MNITKKEAIEKVGDALARSQLNDEYNGGLGVGDLSPSEVLAVLFGGKWTDYKDELETVQRERYPIVHALERMKWEKKA